MHQAEQVTSNGIHWHFAPACRELLRDGSLPFAEWQRTGHAQIVKHGPHRTVWRVTLPGLDVFIKHYRVMNTRAWLRELVRPAKAMLEYRRALAIAARGVPTVEPLAVGIPPTTAGPGESYLITRSLAGAEALSTFLEQTLPQTSPAEQTRLRQLIAGELGRFVASLHASGIAHDDFHAGNILIRLDDGLPKLFLIDLHATRLGKSLSWRSRLANLVILNRYFSMRASRADRRRFWNAYVQAWDAASARSTVRERAKTVEAATWQSNLAFWKQRDARCLLSNRYYQKLRSPAVVGHAVRDLDAAALAQLIADPDAPFTAPGVKLLKDSRSSTVAELQMPVNGNLRPVIYKRFRVTSALDPWTNAVRRPAALRSWIAGQGLLERDLPTARPLAVLHRRRHGLLHEGYLLMEKVPEAQDLHHHVAGLAALPPDERRSAVRRITAAVARLIREMHRRALAHRDLKATNLLVQPAALTVKARHDGLWLIDLVGVTRHRRLPETRRIQNLARLHVSFCQHPLITRTEKLRFLRAYQQWGVFGKAGWKAVWRAVAAATQSKQAKNLRSGRPLA